MAKVKLNEDELRTLVRKIINESFYDEGRDKSGDTIPVSKKFKFRDGTEFTVFGQMVYSDLSNESGPYGKYEFDTDSDNIGIKCDNPEYAAKAERWAMMNKDYLAQLFNEK